MDQAPTPSSSSSGPMHSLVFELVVTHLFREKHRFYQGQTTLQSLRQTCKGNRMAADGHITCMALEYRGLEEAVAAILLGFPRASQLKALKLTVATAGVGVPRALFTVECLPKVGVFANQMCMSDPDF